MGWFVHLQRRLVLHNMGIPQIHVLTPSSDISFLLSEWTSGTEPALFVTGLSGAGKTGMLNSLGQEYDCVAVSLDALRFYEKAPADSQRAVDDFLVLNPGIRQYVKEHWDGKWPNFYGEQEYTKYTNLFVDFLVQRARHKNQRCIIEGIQLFARLSNTALLGRPKIILGTSGIQSFRQAALRDFPHVLPSDIPCLLRRFFRYSVAQRIRLNQYLTYWCRTEQPAIYHRRQSTKKTS